MTTLEERRHKQAANYDRVASHNKRRRGGQIVRKQVSDQSFWLSRWGNIEQHVSMARADVLVERAAEETLLATELYAENGRVAFGWSGGKDSLALQVVMDSIGIRDCVFVITDLEYPEFLSWATDRMPDGCEVVRRAEINLQWLAAHPDLLFPPDAAASGKWFASVQHTGQAEYIVHRDIDLMFLGRRSLDGNMTGKDGYTESKRGRFFSPIRYWTHEEVLAVLHYAKKELPPIYHWPRGFQVGTGPWPARQFCRDVRMGWSEIWEIDRQIVEQAARYIPSAKTFLEEPDV